MLAITGLVTLLIPFVLASRARRLEQANLLQNGARTTGTVLSIGRAAERAGMPMVLRYRFTPEGTDHVVEGQCPASLFSPYKPGDTVVVCYNRSLPSSSIILSPAGQPL